VSRKQNAVERPGRTVISLFTGAGGLDVGLEAAGFDISACVEVDTECQETLRTNRPAWKLIDPGDIHKVTPDQILAQAGVGRGELCVVSGGPPCQPFSKSANWATRGSRGMLDPRAATLHAYLGFVEAALPKVFVLENVRGLSAAASQNGALQPLRDEIDAINRRNGTRYKAEVVHLNAADYGVPQIRERVFIVASIDGHTFTLPPATHGDADGLKPYRTAWDAIGDLDKPQWPDELNPTGKWAGLLKSIPEGRNYLWHTPHGGGRPLFGWRTRYWSFLLKLSKRLPSWTIQAVPGPATGPFHWRSRLLSVEELARLQTFPAAYRFNGDRRSAHRQIGNAVPCALGELLGLEIRRQLLNDSAAERELTLIPKRRNGSVRAHPAGPVPLSYRSLEAKHRDHPGAGLGPGRVWTVKTK
jgi:DNA (cytosine-5)-methyltransferase 1